MGDADAAGRGSALRGLRLAQASTLIGYGGLSLACAVLLRNHVAEEGGGLMWWLALLVSAVYVLLGVLFAWLGERRRGQQLAVGLVFGATQLVHLFGKPSLLLLGASVVAVPFAVLLWPRPKIVRAALGVVGVVVCALLIARNTWRTLSFPPLSGPPVSLEIVLVNESACDVLGSGVAMTGDSPGQATLGREQIGARKCSFIRFEAAANATFDAARRGAEAWAALHAQLPKGTRLAWGRQGEPGIVLRSYPIYEPAILTSADVEDARVQTSDGETMLNVSFESAAAERFQKVTEQHRGERLAMLLDGVVQVAPVIRTEIKGGHVLISMVSMPLSQATGIAAALRGELLHAPAGCYGSPHCQDSTPSQ